MRLKLEELARIVERTLNEERATEALRAEVVRVLGPSVVAEGKAERLAEAANERIDVLEMTGRSGRLDFKPAVMVKFMNHSSPQLRKLAARVVPDRFVDRLANDRDHSVRAAVARRLSVGAVREMLRRFPNDDTVRVIYKQKKLAEAGLPQPKVQDEPFDMHGEERLGDAVKQDPGPELSEQWYRDKALRFMQDYGRNIEYAWEELATRRYVSSVKATSGVEIDESKLLKAIKELIKEREDHALERDALKETLVWLKGQEERERLSEAAMPIIEDVIDPVRDMVEGSLTPATFVEQANKLFKVREATLPPGIRKHRLGEAGRRGETIPVVGYLPHTSGFREIDERALDMYCEAWNSRQALHGEPLRLEWSTHPDQVGKVSFNVVLR